MHGRLTSLVALLVVAIGVSAADAQTAPGPPEGATAVVDGGVVTLTWSAPTTGEAPTHYEVEMVNFGLKFDVGLDTSFTQTLDNGTYIARIRAFNGTAQGLPTPDVTFTIEVVRPPQNLTATVSGSAVTIAWDPPTSGAPLGGYLFELGVPGREAEWQFPLGNVPTFTLPLANGVYVGRLRAVGSTSVGLPTPDITFIVGPPPTGAVPFPPSGLTSAISESTVSLSWNLREDSPPATRYFVEALSPVSGALLARVDTGNPARTATFNNVPNGGYQVRVTAFNQHGFSQLSSDAIQFAIGPSTSCGTQVDPPTGLSYSQSGNFVALTWARPTTAILTGYLIEISGSVNTSFSTGSQITFIAGVIASGTYVVQVRAHDTCAVSTPTNQITVVVP